jgi:maltooligosyltrehalose trehalohydrolase
MSGPSIESRGWEPRPPADPPRVQPPGAVDPAHAPGAPGFRLTRGARVVTDGAHQLVELAVWAPRQQQVRLRLSDRAGDLAMDRTADGLFVLRTAEARAGSDYLYVLDDGAARPDPVSRHQPHGVHGPSRVVDPAFPWTDQGWTGIPLEDHVLYELHVGTFSAAGSFAGVVERLDHLRALGVTAIELMPVAEFPGPRNWGYDGVHLYAPHQAYGGPQGMKRLVDAAHRAGLAVVLDVVYNHVGPEGNYLGQFGPYFTERYRTPWGPAVNFDGAGSDDVRRFFIDNALYWLTEYHVDGLRLDAVHGIFDFGARHILEELGAAFHDEARRLGRRAWVIAESDLNDVRVTRPPAAGGWGLDAQWSDDLHHALHVSVTGNRRGYFEDFHGVRQLGKALTAGFVYDGVHSVHRGRRHGSDASHEPGERFVVFTQNHDQIANGAQGRRLADLTGPALERVAATLLLSAPYLPMLFMGQEYAEPAPFFYFTSHGDPALARAVREGRRQEFLAFFRDTTAGGAGAGVNPQDFPDPQSEETFLRSKLGWSLDGELQAETLAFYKDLIALRRRVPALCSGRRDLTEVTVDEPRRCLALVRHHPIAADEDSTTGHGATAGHGDGAGHGATAVCLANLSDHPHTITAPASHDAGWTLALSTDRHQNTAPDLVAGPGMQVTVPPRTALIYLSR